MRGFVSEALISAARQGGGGGLRPRPADAHPQQPWPVATASALAVAPQQLPAASASAAVPQHGLTALAGAGAAVDAALPQQPPDETGVNASARPALNPPCAGVVVVMAFHSCLDEYLISGTGSACTLFRNLST
jgi:hypothetical protein